MTTKKFKQLSKADVSDAGGKGASLGEMTQAGIPVPPGFVVLASAFDQFLQDTDLNVEVDSILRKVNHKEIHTVENASEKIQGLILHAAMPKHIASEIKRQFQSLGSKFVAVRSSATAEDSASAAWAGQLDSFLNTSEQNLLKNVQRCWASLFTPRAIFYRFEKGLHGTQISVAVVVQKMVQSEVSGIAFSVHPVTQDYNQLIIEAGYGLGEAIVSGTITPDSYVVEKRERTILDKNIAHQTKALVRGGITNEWIAIKNGSQQKISDKKILELSKLIMAIENHYGFPCDIEWALEKNKLYIVQSRPITTLTNDTKKQQTPTKNINTIEVETAPGKEKVIKDTSLSSPTFIDNKSWLLTVTRNMSLWHQCLCNEGAFQHTRDFGIKTNLELITLTVDSTKTSCFVYKENNEKYAKAALEATNTLEKVDKLKGKYEKFAKELLASLDACNKNTNQKTFKEFTAHYRRFTAGLFITTMLGRLGLDALTARLKEIGYNENEIPSLEALITYPEEKTPFFASQIDLLKIGAKIQKEKIGASDIEIELQDWLRKHSHVPVNFCEEPYSKYDLETQLQVVLNESCKDKIATLEKQHAKLVLNAAKKLKIVNDFEVSRLAQTLAKVTTLNEYRKNVFCEVSLNYRPIFRKIAAKLGSKNWRDTFYLKYTEISSVLAGKNLNFKPLIRERQKIAMQVNQTGRLIFLNKKIANDLYNFVYAPKTSPHITDKIIHGFSANKGKVTARAKVIFSSADFSKLLPGEILVTTMTSVDFVPIMDRASAFVTNEGGITSHASIVAREMNKPCIIGTKNATQIIKDGDLVEVDADKGVVSIIDSLNTEQELLKEIKPRTYECIVRFPKISVLSAEAMNEGMIDNPYFSLADTKPDPSGIVFMQDSFEGWVSQKGRMVVSSKKAIRKIEQASLKCIPRNQEIFKSIISANKTELTNSSKLIKLIEKANRASADLYKHFMFFIDESFKTSDQKLIKHLQETRMELDKLVVKFLFPAFNKLTDALVAIHHFSRATAEHATTAEIIAVLKDPQKLKEYSNLQSRPICFVLLDNRLKTIYHQEALDVKMFLANQDPTKSLSQKASEQGVIRGSTGNNGRIKGKVRKLLASEFYDKKKLESLAKDQNYILVVSMTAPELVPYFKHALGFITDEGGITCHAAIIARELGKPCIIGTKIATKILKDGDLVEMDAGAGVVKILQADATQVFQNGDLVEVDANKGTVKLIKST